MDNQAKTLRIFVEDNEVELVYSLLTTNDTIEKVITFLLNELRKRHQTKFIELKDLETDETMNLTKALNKKVCYAFIKCKPELKPKKSLEQRQIRDQFDLTDNIKITLQKYKQVNVKQESVTYTIDVIKQLNDIFSRQNQFFVNDGPAKEQYEQKEIPTPSITLNNEQIQAESKYIPSNKDYGTAIDNDPQDIKKQKKDFQKTGGAGGSYQFVKESQKQQKVEIRGITPEEIAQHNQIHDCWTVYQGKVYDITNYIRYHPGGQKILLGAGKDCTALFQKYHSWVNATYMLQKYQVGFLTFA